jgi:peptidoglycan hydrolase-like protein with peptidoglycan-binding domain
MLVMPVVVCVALSSGIVEASAIISQTLVRNPVVPAGLPGGIEDLARYVPQNSCDPIMKPGSAALGRLLVRTYPGTSFSSTTPCGSSLGTSEHYEGRAIDWMNSVRNPTQAAQGAAVIRWLFAKDAAGHSYANMRRLGIMYLIWNNQIWGAWDGKWKAYSTCSSHPQVSWDSTCHRNHIHFSLSWAGAWARTSFWSKRVMGTDFGPCHPRDLNWAVPYSRPNFAPCAYQGKVPVPARASATLRALIQYSGAILRPGYTGPAVVAVQRALSVSPTGRYGTLTMIAVIMWQRARHLPANGVVTTATWRSMLKGFAPR